MLPPLQEQQLVPFAAASPWLDVSQLPPQQLTSFFSTCCCCCEYSVLPGLFKP